MNEPRKILTLKKKPVLEVPQKAPEPAVAAEKPTDKRLSKEAKKAANMARSKVAQTLASRLDVHKKATNDLKVQKHPMRIMSLNKMLTRLNRHLLLDNGLLVSYDDQGKQILTEIVKTENSVL